MMGRFFLRDVALGAAVLGAAVTAQAAVKPNIVFVLCDDLGYGDIQCLNPERGKILTPGVDRLAKEGMTFTDAHTSASVCSPSRYGLLTGRYNWRTRLQYGVVQGFAPNLIAEDRPTVASYLKGQGYHTAIIGKWHLDFQYTDSATGKVLTRADVKGKGKGKGKASGKKGKGLAPVGSKVLDGPITRGFDYYHGFHHAGDMKGIIENDTVIKHEDEINMLPRLTRKAVEYIDDHGKKKDQPFFLYVPFGSPHTPIVPSKEWQGKSGLSAYADFVMQTDDGFKQILEALDRNGLTDNTLVVFSSDNGCSKAANFKQLAKAGHYPSANLRGSKSDSWDGGHRVPFLVRWPGHIQAGSTSAQTLCLTDFFATCSDILDTPLPENAAEDSVSFLPAFKGEPIVTTRAGIIHHSISGHFSYRLGKWKLILAKGSGGWSSPTEQQVKPGAPIAQLYDMENDIGETTNLYDSNPEVVAQLLKLMEADIERGRSTAGSDSQNDVAKIKLWKSGK
jgi:arylsulfatase A-like enzyme